MKKLLPVILFLQLFANFIGFAQSPSALGTRKVQEYFQDVESKSYYQQERIRSMKGEMNEYSERLHNLQDKFHNIFYGKSTDRSHQTPFGYKEKISYPKRKYREPRPDVESIVPRTKPTSRFQSTSNQLAFNINGNKPSQLLVEDEVRLAETSQLPFEDDQNNPPDGYIEPSVSKTPKFGGYFILRPGIAIPYSGKKTFNGNKVKHRAYNNGPMISIAGGYKWGGLKFGVGVLYRENKHNSKSYEINANGVKSHFANGSKSSTLGGFFETGYHHQINEFFQIYGNLGIGYGVSKVEDYAPNYTPPGYNRTRLNPFFLVTAGTGFTWTPVEFFALSLGYRYLHEEEVPAHAIELGVEGKF